MGRKKKHKESSTDERVTEIPLDTQNSTIILDRLEERVESPYFLRQAKDKGTLRKWRAKNGDEASIRNFVEEYMKNRTKPLAPYTLNKWISAIKAEEPDADWSWWKMAKRGYAKEQTEAGYRIQLTLPAYPDETTPVLLKAAQEAKTAQDIAFCLGLSLSLIRGLRSSDVAQLKWEEARIENNMLIARPAARKGVGASQKFLLTQLAEIKEEKIKSICPVRLYSRLRNALQGENCKTLYLGTATENPHAARDRNYRVKRIAREVKLPAFRCHSLRPTVAQILLAMGVSEREIAEYVGWENINMVRRYTFAMDRSEMTKDLKKFMKISKEGSLQEKVHKVIAHFEDPKAIAVFSKWRSLAGTQQSESSSEAAQDDWVSGTQNPVIEDRIEENKRLPRRKQIKAKHNTNNRPTKQLTPAENKLLSKN